MATNDQQKLLSEIVAKLQDPILLFSISFGFILFSIGAYSYDTIIALRTPLLLIFSIGIVGTVFLKYFKSKTLPAKSKISDIENRSLF